jgi:hypothetical protein
MEKSSRTSIFIPLFAKSGLIPRRTFGSRLLRGGSSGQWGHSVFYRWNVISKGKVLKGRMPGLHWADPAQAPDRSIRSNPASLPAGACGIGASIPCAFWLANTPVTKLEVGLKVLSNRVC